MRGGPEKREAAAASFFSSIFYFLRVFPLFLGWFFFDFRQKSQHAEVWGLIPGPFFATIVLFKSQQPPMFGLFLGFGCRRGPRRTAMGGCLLLL